MCRSPDRAGSYRICSLPIRVLALCRSVVYFECRILNLQCGIKESPDASTAQGSCGGNRYCVVLRTSRMIPSAILSTCRTSSAAPISTAALGMPQTTLDD